MAEKPPAKVVETFRQKPSKLGSHPQPAETVTLQPGPQGSNPAADAMATAARLSNRSKWRLLAGTMLAFNATIGVFAYFRFIKSKPAIPVGEHTANDSNTSSNDSGSDNLGASPSSGATTLAAALPVSSPLLPSTSSAQTASLATTAADRSIPTGEAGAGTLQGRATAAGVPIGTAAVSGIGESLIACMDVKRRFAQLQAQLAEWRAVKPASPDEKVRLNAEKAELKQQLDSVAVLLADACDQM